MEAAGLKCLRGCQVLNDFLKWKVTVKYKLNKSQQLCACFWV